MVDGNGSKTGTGDKPGNASGENQEKKTASGASEAMMAQLFDKLLNNASDGVSPQITDALTQALLTILGTGPSMAAYAGLLDAQATNGMMYYNAVSHQQKSNLLSMAMTAKCVRYMMDPHSDEDLDSWLKDAD